MTNQFELDRFPRFGSSALVVQLEDGTKVRIEAVPSLKLSEYLEESNVARLARVFDGASDVFCDLLLFEKNAEEGEGDESYGFLYWVDEEQYRINFFGNYDPDDLQTAFLLRDLRYVLQGKVFVVYVSNSSQDYGEYEDSLTVYEESHFEAYWEGNSLGLYSGKVVDVLEGQYIAELSQFEEEQL